MVTLDCFIYSFAGHSFVSMHTCLCLCLQGTKVIEACDAAGVRAFPTWVINGRVIEGQLTLEALEEELKNTDPVTAAEVKLPPKSPFADS